MFKFLFPAALLMNIAARYSPYGWGATYGPHPERNLLLTGLLYTTVLLLLMSELREWRKAGIPKGRPVAAAYTTTTLCFVGIGALSWVVQLTSVHEQRYFHDGVLIWCFGTLLSLGIGRRLRLRRAT